MKIFFELNRNFYLNDHKLFLGLAAYKHWFKQYTGFSIEIIFFTKLITITYVSDYKKYIKIMSRGISNRSGLI
jgi:hypothetical protein